MKKPNLFKVGLTTIAMLVLSACGSSGGDDAPSSKGATTPPAAKKENPPATTAPSTTQKEDYMAAVNQALNDAQAAKAKADAAVKAGDVEAARQAIAEANKAVNKANNLYNAAFANQDANSAAVFEKAKAVESLFASLSDAVSKAQTQATQNAAQDQANKSIMVSTVPANHGKSNVGYKHVIKSNSDLMLDGTKKKANNESNTGLQMREQKPNEELDNLTVANLNNQVVYLEDTDLRSANEAAPGLNPDTPVNNKVGINNVYYAQVDQPLPEKKAERKTGKDLIWDTKTEKTAEDNASALIYNKNQQIYLYAGKDESGLKDSGLSNAKLLTIDPKTGERTVTQFADAKVADRTGTTMAIYGAKTVFADITVDPSEPVKYTEDAAEAGKLTQNTANLPILDGGLQYVQYGRVTSQLSGRELKEFMKGLNTTGLNNTHIAPFGKYGEQGTENHYFARGINNTTSEQLAGLSDHYQTTQLVYEGHAEAYGLNNAFSRADKQNTVPTALRGTTHEFLLSGNHIRANVNLKTYQVDGNVYNRWALAQNSPKAEGELKVVETPLVGFQGTLAGNGNIAGTAQNFTQGNAPGILSATLFGPHGEEMGGTIVSDNPAKVQWGLSFGATNVTPVSNVLKPGNSSILNHGTNLHDCASSPQSCIK